jgi:ribosomal protein S18 acetylase RimI-like enzyme
MNSCVIRRASQEDLPTLENLMYQLHDEHHRAEPIHFKTAQEVMLDKSIADYINAPDALVFVASDEQRIVGFITGHFGEFESSISKAVMMGSIDELYVEPAARNKSIGSRLLRRCAQEFDDYGVKQIFVEVWDFNQSALKLYNSLGYESHIHCLRKAIK